MSRHRFQAGGRIGPRSDGSRDYVVADPPPERVVPMPPPAPPAAPHRESNPAIAIGMVLVLLVFLPTALLLWVVLG